MYARICINEKPGYRFSDGTAGKRWIRGRKMYSEGFAYSHKVHTDMGQPVRFPCIIVTDLDTNKMRVASPSEHKRFLTPESYHDFLCEVFKYL